VPAFAICFLSSKTIFGPYVVDDNGDLSSRLCVLLFSRVIFYYFAGETVTVGGKLDATLAVYFCDEPYETTLVAPVG
jgi:hypothetical protein